MLDINLDENSHIVTLEPRGVLSENDFINATKEIDPIIEKNGKLKGLIVHVESFPGWDSFGSFIKHMKFVNEHHQKISHIAFVTNSIIGDLAQHVASHFVNAQIKNFNFDELENAKEWILEKRK